MKATVQINVALQRPATLFGVPPALLVIVIAVASTVYVVMTALSFVYPVEWLTIISLLGIIIGGTAWAWCRGRQEPHVTTAAFYPKRFWYRRKGPRFAEGRAALLSGGPPS